MAIKAPSHAQGLDLHHNFRLRDIPVTMPAIDAGSKMGTVVEIVIIRQFVDSHPSNRHARRHTLPNRKQLFAAGPYQPVTIHTGLNRGDIGVRRSLNLEMAVPTVQSQIAGMQLVAIRNGLDRTVSDIGVPGGAVIPAQPNYCEQHEYAHNHQRYGNLVHPFGEYLSQV